jgi:hypothetical protein
MFCERATPAGLPDKANVNAGRAIQDALEKDEYRRRKKPRSKKSSKTKS